MTVAAPIAQSVAVARVLPTVQQPEIARVAQTVPVTLIDRALPTGRQQPLPGQVHAREAPTELPPVAPRNDELPRELEHDTGLAASIVHDDIDTHGGDIIATGIIAVGTVVGGLPASWSPQRSLWRLQIPRRQLHTSSSPPPTTTIIRGTAEPSMKEMRCMC